jgi:bifunctional non-homologous end joining protein LigD
LAEAARAVSHKAQVIEPRYARLVNELPEGREWLVAEIEFTEWTADGHLRHSKFFSVREDKDPRTVVRELGSGQ